MADSLRVELNEGAVHAIDAPEEATVRGPFHVVLHNAGGPVHVHINLDDDLSEVARLEEANHYVEGGQTSRIPIGIVPDRAPAGGRLKIVSGYGAETTTVDLTVADAPTAGEGTGATDGDTTDRRADAGDKGTRGGTATTAPRGRKRGGPGRRRPRRVESRRGATFFDNSVPDVLARLDAASPEAVAFLGLAAVAVLVGLWVIAAVGEVLLSLVVVAVVTAAVAVAGWLLLE